MKKKKKVEETPKSNRPSLKETMAMAEKFWGLAGPLTGFPSKESYFAFIEDFYKNKLARMSDVEFAEFQAIQQKDTIRRLQGVEKYVETRLNSKKAHPQA